MWALDKDWMKRANPAADQAETRRDEIDLKILKKRRQGRVLKNLAME